MTGPIFDGRRLIVCLGPGGVGKTTISAALAIRAALSGRSVDVITVDPAPRLLDALGLNHDCAGPYHVALDGKASGELRALKLDPKATFDELVGRYAPSRSARDAILSNRIYANLSSALAGVGDYMAMEKLLELCAEPARAQVVLDTPPAREALDFLDAPRRLLELLNSRAVGLLGGPRKGLALVDLAARAILAAFDRLTGLHLLADVQSFVKSFDGMYSGFAERAERAQALIRSADTLIVVITTPEPDRIGEALAFVSSLDAVGLKLGALIVNLSMPALPKASELERIEMPIALRRKLIRNLRDFSALKLRETASLSALRGRLARGTPIVLAPDLGREPRTIADLAEIGQSLVP